MLPQSADRLSRIARLRRVGGIATMPTRVAGLALVIADILPQLDRLYVYLDGHETVPACVRHPKIVVLRSQMEGPWWSSGKFLGLERERLDCVYCTFDDDIRYSPDHVERLVAGLVRYDGEALVGFHASFFYGPCRSYNGDRLLFPFMNGLLRDMEVDMLGSATTAMLPERLPIAVRSWPYLDIDDFMLSLAAERSGVRRMALARPVGYMRAIAIGQQDSLTVQTAFDDSRHARYMNLLLELERRSPRGLPPRPTRYLRPVPPASRSP